MIRLYYWFTRSGRAEQIRLLLAELGLEWQEVDTEWNSPAWEALYPVPLAFRAQPAILDGEPDPSGRPGAVLEFPLTQSGVILSYLARKHGIAPADLQSQARADALAWTAEDLRMGLFRATSGAEAGPKTAKFLAEEWPRRWLDGFERQLAATGTGFLVGDALTHADVAVWDALDQVLTALPAAKLPEGTRLAAFFDAIRSRPRIAAYLASERRPPAGE